MDLINQIKKKILSSSFLLEKCKNFEKLEKKYLNKGLDDFSFNLKDEFWIDLDFEDKKLINESVESIDLNEYSYFKYLNSNIDRYSLDSNLEFLTNLGICNYITLGITFDLKLKQFFDSSEFKIKELPKFKTDFFYRNHSKKYNLLAIEVNDFSFKLGDFGIKDQNIIDNFNKNRKFILGCSDLNSEEILNELNKIRDYFNQLEIEIKKELFELFLILNSKYEYIEKNFKRSLNEDYQKELLILSKILNIDLSNYQLDLTKSCKRDNLYFVNLWLDKNCDKKYRKFIEANDSGSEFWLKPKRWISKNIKFTWQEVGKQDDYVWGAEA